MTRPFVIGLTGSIGMGKSTTLGMFAEAGLPVWDADAAVHRLYAAGGDAVGPIGQLWPPAIVDGAVDRQQLKDWMQTDPTALPRIERIVHPLVAADRDRFIAGQQAPMVVVDVPLLFETGGAARVDHVVVVTAPPEVQKARVMARPGMTEALFATILAKQMPDAEKRSRADNLVVTDDMDSARQQVADLLRRLGKDAPHA
ncbi:hypothetical protein LCGC14_1404260 [marine sediment metagenome]|uniref:Dephospho-CoA kinase n=1 Tax=marine sediment metagenome TaxID=412755 RepID=A0A0F9MBK9_9ZZZZ